MNNWKKKFGWCRARANDVPVLDIFGRKIEKKIEKIEKSKILKIFTENNSKNVKYMSKITYFHFIFLFLNTNHNTTFPIV